MTPDTERNMTDGREVIESNVRRIVGIAALRRIHKAISDRREADRILRTVIAPIAALVMIVVAALIWTFGGPRAESTAPLPECAPPRGEMISV
jgi:hypothetical protein